MYNGHETVLRSSLLLLQPQIDKQNGSCFNLFVSVVVQPRKRAWQKLRKHFGDEFFHSDGTLDRERLAQLVFADSTQKQILDSITHPEIQKCIVWQLIGYLLRGTVVSKHE